MHRISLIFSANITTKICNPGLAKSTNKKQNIWLLIPLFGTIIFACLYFVATLFYPGGSQVDQDSKGFSWINNYWCNLLNESAMNGQHNFAKPIALTAMCILCFTLAYFWYIFSRRAYLKRSNRLMVQVAGTFAMITCVFIFTGFHDTIVNMAGFFGMIAMTGTFIGLYKLNWKSLFWLGIFNLVLIIVNNILYYGEGLKLYLPLVQKITFLFFLIWICLIDINLFRKANSKIVYNENEQWLKLYWYKQKPLE